MEQFNIRDWIKNNNYNISEQAIEKLIKYSEILFNENAKFNLTGKKTLGEVQEILISKSIQPIVNLSVPRGTSYADIGTGGGIPGIVIAILFPEINGTLFDANNKKTDFLKRLSERLEINNVNIVNGRLEDICNNKEYREQFDLCFSRAFGPVYYSLEFGLSLLKQNGSLYIYSVIENNNVLDQEKEHCNALGGEFVLDYNKYSNLGLDKQGLLINKISTTLDKYPRRFPVIKREASKIYD